jgi:hypothetical protein
MKLQDRNGVVFPAKMKFRSWIVCGPPGSGKSYLIDKIGGWPGEVGIDITMKKWWAVEPLTHRPREIHFALPFKGSSERYAVYDEKWSATKKRPGLDIDRIRLPGKKKFILAPDWRARFVFDFILPPPAWLFRVRRDRLHSDDARLVDLNLTPELVAWQVEIHWRLARFLHQSGMQVMVRPFNTVRPYSLRALKKIMQKKGEPAKLKVKPSVNWSKLRNVRAWVAESSRDDWSAPG